VHEEAFQDVRVAAQVRTPQTAGPVKMGVRPFQSLMPKACANRVRNSSYLSPMSRRTMLRKAAFASTVVASIRSFYP